ncbi:hypothetical protein C8R44DRAFT_987849 [Mycena epipterygia]|nr:hypothetical protein C8R44DRAFT_987849 [Mycena epipterygia]
MQIDRPPRHFTARPVRRSRTLPAGCTWNSRRPMPACMFRARPSVHRIHRRPRIHESVSGLFSVRYMDDVGGAGTLASAHAGGEPGGKDSGGACSGI